MRLELHIVTPQGTVYQGSVQSVVVPGEEGDFGVLPGHERFLAPMRIGELEIRANAVDQYAAVAGGFADVSGDRVTLLAETCELAGDIDQARAERARARAEHEVERLRDDHDESVRFRLEELALQRAVVRISVARKGK